MSLKAVFSSSIVLAFCMAAMIAPTRFELSSYPSFWSSAMACWRNFFRSAETTTPWGVTKSTSPSFFIMAEFRCCIAFSVRSGAALAASLIRSVFRALRSPVSVNRSLNDCFWLATSSFSVSPILASASSRAFCAALSFASSDSVIFRSSVAFCSLIISPIRVELLFPSSSMAFF